MTLRPSQEYSLLDRGIRKLWFCNKNKDDAYQEYNSWIVRTINSLNRTRASQQLEKDTQDLLQSTNMPFKL